MFSFVDLLDLKSCSIDSSQESGVQQNFNSLLSITTSTQAPKSIET